jgi:hypothetical protein
MVIGALTVGLFAVGAFADSFSLFGKAKTAGETGPGSEIEVPVSSGFGVYNPYVVPRYRPQIGLREPAVAANFSNVTVADPGFPWGSYFSAGERALLQKNNFVARPEAIGTFGQAYAPELASVDMGSFITVDALLHGLRVTVDETVRDMEKNYAVPALRDQLDDLAQSVASGATAERSQSMVAAGLQLLAYIQTGQVLLDPSASVDPRVSNEVATEVRNIKAAAGRGISAVFPGRAINYAIFVPVGYYTIDPKLGNYYRAKTWLSAVGFNLRTQGGDPDLVGVRAAALLARTIDGLAQGDFRERYEDINEPLAFFSGSAAQGSSYGVLANSMKSYYGRMASLGTGFLNDDESLRSFVGYMEQQLPAEFSRRGSQPLFRILDWSGDAGQGEMAQLWSDAGSSSGSYGLAVMGALGSQQAAAIQDAGSLRTMFSSQAAESWTQDLGHAVLYTVQPLAVTQVRPEGYPRFMRSDAWTSRELTTALGAWADFQHPTAMLPISSVAKAGSVGSGGRSSDLRTAGYVEPNPEGWARIASLAGYLRNGLVEERSDRMIGRKMELKLQDIENVSAKLMQIAAAELNGTDLTSEQLELIRVMPSRIAAYETFADKSLQGDGYPVSAGAARVAGSTVASGHPLAIYVIVPRNDGEDGLMLTRGAIASYYENGTSPEEMVRSLTTVGSPIRPDARLVGSYVASDRSFAQDLRKLQAVTASMPGTAATYVPTKQEQKSIAPKGELSLESTVVSRSSGELWFTVHAPQLEGNDLVVTVAGSSGQTVLRSEIGRVQNGERFDMIRIGNLNNGQYFIRIADLAGKPIASGRFMVVR